MTLKKLYRSTSWSPLSWDNRGTVKGQLPLLIRCAWGDAIAAYRRGTVVQSGVLDAFSHAVLCGCLESKGEQDFERCNQCGFHAFDGSHVHTMASR